MMSAAPPTSVIPAEAGTSAHRTKGLLAVKRRARSACGLSGPPPCPEVIWVPACAGMTSW
jgi:hypothetical protein